MTPVQIPAAWSEPVRSSISTGSTGMTMPMAIMSSTAATRIIEIAGIRDRALKEASEEQKRVLEAARAESQRLVDAARAQLEADIRRAREELRREVAELGTAVAEKLVRKSLREEDHRRIVAEAIGQLKG